jgi:hypothetical protein
MEEVEFQLNSDVMVVIKFSHCCGMIDIQRRGGSKCYISA